jgi:hypothetical protein
MKPVLILPLILIIIMPTACAEFYELTPTGDDNYINNDTVINFSASPYNINDSGSAGALIINASDLTLDCNGSVFIGNETGTGIHMDFDNVTIVNCNISGYQTGIMSMSADYLTLKDNNISYNNIINVIHSSVNHSEISTNTMIGASGTSLLIALSDSAYISGNHISDSPVGLSVFGSSNITTTDNRIESSGTGIDITDSSFCLLYLDSLSNNAVDISLTDSFNNTILGVNFTSIGIINVSNTDVSWVVVVNVTDENSIPVDAAHLEFFDRDGNKKDFIDIQTGPDGLTAPLVLAEYIINNSINEYWSPYTINVSADGYYNASFVGDVNRSMQAHVSLSEIGTTPPNLSATADPYFVLLGENVSISINASDDAVIDAVLVSIIDPNSAINDYNFTGLGLPEVSLTVNHTSGIEGIYTVLITSFNTNFIYRTISSEFVGVPGFLDITSTVRGHSNQNLVTTLELFITGASEAYFTGSSQIGDFMVLNAPDTLHNMLFSGHNDSLRVLLKEVDISQNNASYINLDLYDNTDPGYGDMYAIETNYSFTSSEVTLYYDEDDFWDESGIEVYRCVDWSFSGRSCNGTWEEVTINEYSTADDYVRITATGFSAFTARESNVSFCGDGICQADESPTSCEADCACLSGATRACSLTKQGICSVGNEDCVAGAWAGCPPAETETCNRLDDDCDGVTDNIGGGTSVAETQCICYNDATPQAETCNGLDDDCDGQIDEDGDCCTNGQTRNCGPSSNAGICQYGTSTCANNVWGVCGDAVYPMSSEICFNDEDDDCDGEVDELCDHCTNGVMDYNEEGVDCGGSCDECLDIISQYLPYILIGMGIIVIVVLVAVFMYFKKHGRELTWEEVMKRYTPTS